MPFLSLIEAMLQPISASLLFFTVFPLVHFVSMPVANLAPLNVNAAYFPLTRLLAILVLPGFVGINFLILIFTLGRVFDMLFWSATLRMFGVVDT